MTWRSRRLASIVSLSLIVSACGSGTVPEPATPVLTPEATPAASPAPSVVATEAAPPSPAPDIRATRLRIPSLGIDAPVGESLVVPNDAPPPPGCDPAPPGQTTLTVPPEGIVTPVDSFEGFEGRVWIFGHSRGQGRPGLLSVLPDLRPGDEVVVDGVDRGTGELLLERRYIVAGVYLADRDSGHALVTGEAASAPSVILQTSVRESGEGRPWIFDRASLMATAENLVEGDMDDPCKYLLLFVIARPA